MPRFPIVLAMVAPAAALRCDLGRARNPAVHSLRRLRAAPLRLAEDGDDLDSGLEAALRKALSEMPPEELVESDRRLMDGLVEDRKGEVSAFQSVIDKELASVQGSLESKLDGKLRSLEGAAAASDGPGPPPAPRPPPVGPARPRGHSRRCHCLFASDGRRDHGQD